MTYDLTEIIENDEENKLFRTNKKTRRKRQPERLAYIRLREIQLFQSELDRTLHIPLY